MTNNELVAPFVKWVGGKRQLLKEITPLIPKDANLYCEPFLGGGAVLFSTQPQNAVINDLNRELMLVYRIVRDNVEALISVLETYQNTKECFYKIRALDRDKSAYQLIPDIEKAARTLYLNKTCFNGLFRVNAKGEFNTAFGRYKNPSIVNAPTLRAVSVYLNENNIQILNEDFSDVLQRVPENSFVYLDPPYDPASNTANFTKYNSCGFSRDDQIRLKTQCDELTRRGVKFLLSNSATAFIKDLYHDYAVTSVYSKRSVNSDANKRGAVEEVLVRNYD